MVMLEVMAPAEEPRHARDAAVLLLGMTGALRRSELAGLCVGDVVTDRAEGLEVTVRRSKTDQHRRGQVVGIPDTGTGATSPRAALLAWLDWLGRRPHQGDAEPSRLMLPAGAPLFRAISRRQGDDPRARIGVKAGSPGPGRGTRCAAGSPPPPTPAAPTRSRSCATAAGPRRPRCAATSRKEPGSARPTPYTDSPSARLLRWAGETTTSVPE
jgi:hypothetical protein